MGLLGTNGVQSKEVVQRDSTFAFERNKWRGQIFDGVTNASPSFLASAFADAVDYFLGVTTCDVDAPIRATLVTNIQTFFNSYYTWSTNGFPSSGSIYDNVKNAQKNLNTKQLSFGCSGSEDLTASLQGFVWCDDTPCDGFNKPSGRGKWRYWDHGQWKQPTDSSQWKYWDHNGWHDLDYYGDNSDEDKYGLKDVVVTLTGPDGDINISTDSSDDTDKNGQYSFPNLRPGRYTVAVVLPQSVYKAQGGNPDTYTKSTTPNPVAVTLHPGGTAYVNFGLTK